MNSMEDRLRDAYREAAETVRPEEIRGLRAWIEQPVRHRTRATARPARSLAPLIAAAAVGAIAITTAVVVPHVLSANSRGHHATTGSRPSASAHVARPPAGLPEFAIAASSSGLSILDTATWKPVAHVAAPAGEALTAVAGAADDRTFVVAADENPQNTCETWLYQLHLNSQGQPGALSLLVPKMAGLPTSVAISADAATVAYSVVHCASGSTGTMSMSAPIGNIAVLNVATKQVRQWSFTLGEDNTNDLSTSADGSLVGFSSFLDGSPTANPLDVGRVLSANAQPGTVRQRDRIVVQPAQTSNSGVDAVALSADGHTMYACTHGGSSGTDVTETLGAYDSTTGQLTRTLFSWHAQDPNCRLTADPAGGFLLLTTEGAGKAPVPGIHKVRSGHGLVKIRAGAPPADGQTWIDLATGGSTTLRVKLPFDSSVAL